MARLNNQISQQEVEIYKTWCAANNVIAVGEDGVQNGNLVSDYFLVTWPNEITATNLALAAPALMPHLHQYSAVQLEFNAVLAKLTPAEAKIFEDWKPPKGLKQTERAGTAILSWLIAHKFEITQRNLDLAVGQKTVAPFLEYEYVNQHQPSQHSVSDNGEPFLGTGLVKQRDGSLGRSPLDYARERREASQAATPQPTVALDADDQRWKSMADKVAGSGNRHSQRDQLRKAYADAVAQGLGWRKVYEAVNKLYVEFRRTAMTADRSGYYRR